MPRLNPEQSDGQLIADYLDSGGYHDTAIRNYNRFYRTYSSVNSPEYFKYSSIPHGLPDNNHQSKITERKIFGMRRLTAYVNGTWNNYLDSYEAMFSLPLPADHSYELSHSSLCYEKAKARCISKVKGLDINVAQAVAEVQQTMNTVGSTAKTLAKAFLEIKKGKFVQGMKSLGLSRAIVKNKKKTLSPNKSVADNWLALQYGWLPLLSDIDGACKKLAQRQFPPVYKFKGRATTADSQQIFKTGPATYGRFEWYELQYKCETEFMMAFCKGNHTARTMSELGISDPALLVWELLPYSFVVDWFLPVGNYLASINYTDGLVFKTGYVRQFSTNAWLCKVSGNKLHVGGPPEYNQTFFAATYLTSRNVWLSRTRLTSAPRPSIPQLKNPLSPTHMLNGLALLAKAFR
jgi:hypothetical protein